MTEQTINLRYLAESQPSLCIPRVFNNIDETRIRRVFEELELGEIRLINVIERKSEKGETFKRVFIHFDKWFWNEDAQTARKKLILGKEIKIVYDNPWFWKVSACRSTEKNADKKEDDQYKQPKQNKQKPHIDFDDFDTNTNKYTNKYTNKKPQPTTNTSVTTTATATNADVPDCAKHLRIVLPSMLKNVEADANAEEADTTKTDRTGIPYLNYDKTTAISYGNQDFVPRKPPVLLKKKILRVEDQEGEIKYETNTNV
jgi:hypothetical protein